MVGIPCTPLLLAACQIGLQSFSAKDDPQGEATPWDSGLQPLDTASHDGNGAPWADAGPDLAVVVGDEALLDGTGSGDPDDDPLAWSWSLLSAPPDSAVAIQDADLPVARLIPDVPGLYEVELVVSDGALEASDTAVVQAEAGNSPPVADAGTDANVAVGSFVQLDGRGSYDPDGDPLNYAWTLSRPAGSAAMLSNPSSATPTFTVDVAGTYEATLVVDDGQLASAPDTVRVFAASSGSSGSSGCSCSSGGSPLAGRLAAALLAAAALFLLARWRRAA